MSLLVDLQVVPRDILQIVKARILANRAKLQQKAEQEKITVSTRPRPQQRRFGADAMTYRRPEPAATQSGVDYDVILIENLWPENYFGGLGIAGEFSQFDDILYLADFFDGPQPVSGIPSVIPPSVIASIRYTYGIFMVTKRINSQNTGGANAVRVFLVPGVSYEYDAIFDVYPVRYKTASDTYDPANQLYLFDRYRELGAAEKQRITIRVQPTNFEQSFTNILGYVDLTRRGKWSYKVLPPGTGLTDDLFLFGPQS